MQIRKLLVLTLCCFLPFALVGCGAGPKPIKVSGKITLDGQPLSGASVTFVPKTEGGRTATGSTDTSGVYRLGTFGAGDGALAGEYKVVIKYSEAVSEDEMAPPSDGKINIKEMMDKFGKIQAQRKKEKRQPKFKVPEKYSNPTKTDLSYKVPGGSADFDIKSGS